MAPIPKAEEAGLEAAVAPGAAQPEVVAEADVAQPEAVLGVVVSEQEGSGLQGWEAVGGREQSATE